MSLRAYIFAIVFVSIGSFVNGFYSIHYFQGTGKTEIVNSGSFFKEAPTAEHVADIYTRLCGVAPIFREDNINLPSANILTLEPNHRPFLLEVRGGRLPLSAQPIISASAFSENYESPKVDNVAAVLKSRGLSVDTKIIQMNDYADDVASFLEGHKGPVVILHHEAPSNHHYIHRSLFNNNVKPLTEFQISQYQICLWTGVVMVLLVLASICSIVNMEVIPDSLLVAKFLSQRTGGKHD